LLFLLTYFESKKHSVAFLIFGLTLLLPFFSIFTGHAGVQNDHLLIRVTADWCHSVAVGVWTGGLWMLHVWLGKRLSVAKLGPEVSLRVVTRFSHFAIVSTFVIAVSGLAMAYLAGVSLFQPWSSTYGQWILAKVFFFVAALLAASVNQFVYLRRWTPENDLKFSRGVRREVLLELIFLSVVFVLAGFLARTALP
jgi:putative copper export protein